MCWQINYTCTEQKYWRRNVHCVTTDDKKQQATEHTNKPGLMFLIKIRNKGGDNSFGSVLPDNKVKTPDKLLKQTRIHTDNSIHH